MRRFVVALTLIGLVSLVPVVPTRAASFPLPESATVVFPGHGWGHGHGMGQWGAKGMADAGASWRDIVTHYYSGITIGSRAAESIRVLVETSSDTLVTSDSPFAITWSTGASIATSDTTYKYWRAIHSGSSYIAQKATAYAGPWTTVASSTNYVVFKPGTSMLQLILNSGVVRYYRGTIIARYASGAGLRSVNELPMQQYLYGSVPRESPALWPAEELKAQAVAARSYAAYKKDAARAAGAMYDICSTTMCQMYLGYASKPSPTGTKTVLENPNTNSAVDNTAGQVLLYGGKVILAEYSSSTGGYSAPGTVGYEKAVPDPTDVAAPLHNWTGAVKVSAIEAAWPSIGRLVDVTVTQRNGYGDWGGRVLQMQLIGTSSTATISGWGMQGAFDGNGVRSNWFLPLYWRGQIVSVPSSLAVLQGTPLTVVAQIKNTGSASWPIGGSVRIATPSASVFYTTGWISSMRVASVARNLTSPSSSTVGPGQIAEFRLPLSTNIAPGMHSQRFDLIADGSSVTSTSFTVAMQVLKPWVAEAPDLLTNSSFESTGAWIGSGLASGDGATTAFSREGTHSFVLGAGTKSISQTIAFGGGRARRFTLGGWNRSDSTQTSGGPISIAATARYADGTSQNWTIPFVRAPHAWTYSEATVQTSATKDLVSLSVRASISSQTGATYYDALRLLENHIANASFEQGMTGWTGSGLANGDGVTILDKRDGAQSLALSGSSGSKSVSQALPLRAARSERLILSGWNKAVSTTSSGGPIGVVLSLHHPDGSVTDTTLSFPKASHDWTLVQTIVHVSDTVDAATVKTVVGRQTGTVYFDDISLLRSWDANVSFEGSISPWSSYGFTNGDGLVTSAARGGASSLQISAGGRKGARQYLAVIGSSSTRLIVSGWSKTAGTSATGGPVAVLVQFVNADGTTTYRALKFSAAPHDWTYGEAVVAAAKPFSRIVVFAIFYDQSGSAWFDGIRARNV